MKEDINTILEINTATGEHPQTYSIRVSKLAAASIILAFAIIPVGGASVFMFAADVYEKSLKALNGLLFYTCFTLAVCSVLLGIAGIFRIALNKRHFRGYRYAIGGIVLSVIFSVIYYFLAIGFALSHMW